MGDTCRISSLKAVDLSGPLHEVPPSLWIGDLLADSDFDLLFLSWSGAVDCVGLGSGESGKSGAESQPPTQARET